MKQRGFIAITFVIGCATGSIASQIVVPPVRAGTHPTRWEYACRKVSDQLSVTMSELGEEGWELVSAFPSYLDHKFGGSLEAEAITFCSKRALP